MMKAKDKEYIALRVYTMAKDRLRDLPFEQGLPELKQFLWKVASEYGITDADVFQIYVEWASKSKQVS